MRLYLIQQSDYFRENIVAAFLFGADEREPAVALLGHLFGLGGDVILESDRFFPNLIAGKGEDLIDQFKDFRSGAVAFEQRMYLKSRFVVF